MICRAVNSPACKILFDMYHMQRNEGHIIPNIDLAWDEIAYFQIGDVPGPQGAGHRRDELQEHLQAHPRRRRRPSNREFIFGMEHGNAFPGKDGDQKLIDAYVWSDAF